MRNSILMNMKQRSLAAGATIERESGVELEVRGVSAHTRIDSEAIRRALVNLMRNAVQASPEGARVVVSVGTQDSWAVVQVEDRGRGANEETLSRAFEAFFSTSAERGGPEARETTEAMARAKAAHL